MLLVYQVHSSGLAGMEYYNTGVFACKSYCLHKLLHDVCCRWMCTQAVMCLNTEIWPCDLYLQTGLWRLKLLGIFRTRSITSSSLTKLF